MQTPATYSSTYLGNLPDGAASPTIPDLEGELRRLVDEGRAAWPSLALDAHLFVQHIAERAASCGPLGAVHGGDLYLACACSRAVPGALDAFDEQFEIAIERGVARIDPSRSFAEEVRQVVYERLFVWRGEPPKILEYAGRAALRSWLSIVAVRVAIDLARKGGDRAAQRLHREGVGAEGVGLELEYLKRRHKGDFEGALRAAILRLPERDRTLLRLHFAEGANVDRIGAFFGVSRATAARWLARAREELASRARSELCAQLRLTSSEYDSLAGLVRSRLELSVGHLLVEAGEPPPG